MRFGITQKIVTFALAVVAVMPVLISGEIGPVFTVLFLIVAAAGWFLNPPVTRNPRFRQGVTGIVFLSLTVQIIRLVTGEHLAMLGMEFTVLLLAIKLSTRGYASDYYQIVVLSFLEIIAGTIVTDDVIYAFCLILFVALCPPVLSLTYLRQEMERRFGPTVHSDGSEMLERLLRSKRIVSSSFLVGSSLLSLPVLLVTATLFVLFPRFGFGFLGRLPKSGSEVGFGDQVTLGDLDIVKLEDTVLIRLEPNGHHDQLPPYLPLRLRGAVFDEFVDNTWKHGQKSRWRPLERRGSDFILDRTNAYGLHPGFDVLLESIKPPLLFIPEGTGRLYTHPVARRGLIKPRRLETNNLGVIRYRDDAQVGIRYRVHLTDAGLLGDPPGPRAPYLQLPGNSERLSALAKKLAPNGDARIKALTLITNLKKNYKYSLRLASDERNTLAETPLYRFLFTRKTGTCEHFATALTLMLRAHNIPARLVTGFSGAQWNSVGEYYAVRKRFAHSWTEAFIDGRWVSLDATPSAESTEVNRISQLSQFLDAVRMRWHKHVVGYDMGMQAELAIGLWRLWARNFSSRGIRGQVIWKVSLTLLVTFIAAAFIYTRWRWRRRPKKKGKQKVRSERALQEATKLYLLLERRLSKLGHARPRGLTPLEHVSLLNHNANINIDSVAEVTTRYNEVRFGASEFLPGEFVRLRRQISLIKQSNSA